MEQAWASDSRGGSPGVAIAIFPGGILQLMAARMRIEVFFFCNYIIHTKKHKNIQHDGSLGSGISHQDGAPVRLVMH